MTTKEDRPDVRELSEDEGWDLFEKATKRELGLTAKEFLGAWDAGKYDDSADHPKLMRVVMLLPFVRR